MKLNYKIYSPFFIFLVLLILFSCTKATEEFSINSPLSVKDSTSLSAYSSRAEKYFNEQIYDSAFACYNKARELQATAKDSLGQGHSLISMAEIQKTSGDYFGCEETTTEALPLLENLHYKNYLSKETNVLYQGLKKQYLSKAYNLLGISYKNRSITAKALEYYDKAKRVAKDSSDLCTIENNKATIFIENQQYQKAYKILSTLIISDTVLNNSSLKALVLNNLGNVSNILKKPRALNFLEESLKIRALNNDETGMALCYIQLGKFYATRDKRMALLYAQKGYELTTKKKNTDKRLEALKVVMSVSAEKEAALKYIVINDSLLKARLRAKSEFASIKYDAKKTEAENLRLKTDQAEISFKAQQDKLYIAITVGLILIISASTFFIQRANHKKAKQEEVHKTESRMSKKIHDELANEVFDTLMYTNTLHFDMVQKGTLMKKLDVVYEKTRDISRENSAIDTGEGYYECLSEMLARYKTDTTNVLPVNAATVEWQNLDKYKKKALYLILQEFMVNMKKHSQASLIVIKFDYNPKRLLITYTDNGVGIDKEKSFSKNGLINADSRINLVNGSLTFEDATNGCKISIVIPLSRYV